jgi:hypothetical protein
MNTDGVRQTDPLAAQQLALAVCLLERLHVGGDWWLYVRPQGRGYESDWRKAPRHGPPRQSWLLHDDVFFGVHPHVDIPTTNAQGKKRDQRWVRGTVHNIAAINALFVEIDAKDTIAQEEWLPLYTVPDVEGMTRPQARGALQKAQTAAIDAALPLHLDRYKQRALGAINAAPLRPSACWDSGGGYQAVWLLDATVAVSDANRTEIAQVQKEWVRLVGGDPSASDLNRVLRLPGSVNRKPKYGSQGHPVTFGWCDLDRVYALSALAALLPDLPGTGATTARRVYVPQGLPQGLGDFASVPRLPNHRAIEIFNAATNLRELLVEFGYTDAGSGRMHRPGGNTAGVQLHADNTASIYSSADPLWCGHRITPAHALCVFAYDGDVGGMLEVLAGRRPTSALGSQAETVPHKDPTPAMVQLPLQLPLRLRAP